MALHLGALRFGSVSCRSPYGNATKTAEASTDIIHSGECMAVKEGVRLPQKGTCSLCGYISSQQFCKACVLLKGLNQGVPRLGVGKSSKDKAKIRLRTDKLRIWRSVLSFSLLNCKHSSRKFQFLESCPRHQLAIMRQ
ncbi:hypothetical protein HPB51_014810 [Rhipicephalus microplus]|uniref:Cytoplasmic tRNA 2-thiolation protein 1 C-terminal domain-containing protein n=1 Tax=Rhipicephalus microplus TaxID=6941 RepID=A0A9J6DNF5_RHIMP|nr:hypothetical protein HPB51_014810 [Rhipicephalus microplus]